MSGGALSGGATPDGVPFVLSRGHIAVSRAVLNKVGADVLQRANAFGPMRPDITVVEPDGTLTEIEGVGP